jgi:4-hydroxybenzoate polyprenyltransferase
MQKCNCTHHKMTPLFIILIGLVFLLGATGSFSAHAVDIIWPILLILLSITKWAGNSCKCCKAV